MKLQEESENNQRKLLMNILVIVAFAALMVFFIVRLYSNEPNLHRQFMLTLAEQFQRTVTNAHWQWQADGRPAMIMLVHYNDAYQETDRRPVKMAHFGWPKTEPTSEGCGKLWQMLLNLPLTVDGFRIIPEYYQGELVNNEPLNSRCRFRLSTGAYFDYHIYSGNVDNAVQN